MTENTAKNVVVRARPPWPAASDAGRPKNTSKNVVVRARPPWPPLTQGGAFSLGAPRA